MLRAPNSGTLDGAAYLPISYICPNETKIIEKACYKEFIAPEDTEAFNLPEPGPEDRAQYWEFKALEM